MQASEASERKAGFLYCKRQKLGEGLGTKLALWLGKYPVIAVTAQTGGCLFSTINLY